MVLLCILSGIALIAMLLNLRDQKLSKATDVEEIEEKIDFIASKATLDFITSRTTMSIVNYLYGSLFIAEDANRLELGSFELMLLEEAAYRLYNPASMQETADITEFFNTVDRLIKEQAELDSMVGG